MKHKRWQSEGAESVFPLFLQARVREREAQKIVDGFFHASATKEWMVSVTRSVVVQEEMHKNI